MLPFSGGGPAGRPVFNVAIERPSTSRGRSASDLSRASVPPIVSPSRSSHDPSDGAGNTPKVTAAGVSARLDASFVMKSGKRHHAFDAKAAPYPLSYDAKMVDVDVLDHIFFVQARENVTWVDFKDRPPTRSLDLGCGTGVWVLDAAKAWKDCQFVGFDLVRMQPDLHLLPPDVANRIQWKQGNFLSGKLPFDDNSFDHVHIYRVSWGIGEMQWDALFEEIARILCPGGAIEVAEEDILFPILPRSYTIHAKPRPSAPYPRPSLTLSPPPSPLDPKLSSTSHAHALLESLFFAVFESRLINLRPTAIIPHHLNIYFRQVLSTPNLECPFPPPPLARQRLRHVSSDLTVRPTGHATDESESSESVIESTQKNQQHQQQQTPPTTNSSQFSLSESDKSGKEKSKRFMGAARPSRTVQALLGSFHHTEPSSMPLLPPILVNVSDRSLALQLHSAYQRILGCKEAMWEELKKRILLRRAGGQDLLQELDWDEEEEGEAEESDSGHGHGNGGGQEDSPPVSSEARELERARTRFEEMLGRFEQDLRYRTALTDVVETTLGWPKPPPPSKSKHERAREVELEKAIAEAAKTEEEGHQVSRSFKYFVGFKEGKR